ncbi:MAG: hypothetical protein ACRDSK_31925 [Actinophytocola sp.]|uniref:hypothetical protein n=1 Tax=Actinophytocola sp. TaxID=1872138 RepID=UPI003D6A577E
MTIGTVGIAFAASVDRPAAIVLVEQDLDASGPGYGLALGGLALGALAVQPGGLRRPRAKALGCGQTRPVTMTKPARVG